MPPKGKGGGKGGGGRAAAASSGGGFVGVLTPFGVLSLALAAASYQGHIEETLFFGLAHFGVVLVLAANPDSAVWDGDFSGPVGGGVFSWLFPGRISGGNGPRWRQAQALFVQGGRLPRAPPTPDHCEGEDPSHPNL